MAQETDAQAEIASLRETIAQLTEQMAAQAQITQQLLQAQIAQAQQVPPPPAPQPPIPPPPAPLANPVAVDVWYDDPAPQANPAAANAALPAALPAVTDKDKAMKAQLDKLENVLRKSKGFDYLLDIEGLFKAPQVPLPEKFKMPDMEKFDGTGRPKSHLRLYASVLQPLGLQAEHFAMLFPRTLTGSALDWYLTVEPSVIRDWDSLHRAFVEQYVYNESLDITLRDLETTRQEPRETLAAYVTRWRAKAAKMLKRPDEGEQVDIVVKNLQPEYLEHLEYNGVETFQRLMKIGATIEDNIRSGKIRRDTSTIKGKRPMYPNNPMPDVNALAPVHAPQHQRPYQPQGQYANTTAKPPPRQFTPFGAPMKVVLSRLVQKGLLRPLDPFLPPNPLPANYRQNAYCDFHQSPGHDTERCMRLKHEVQNLIDNRTIAPPAGNAPNIITNPLPNHRAVPPPANINFIEYSDKRIDPAIYIVPIIQSTSEVVSLGLLALTVEGSLMCKNLKGVRSSSVGVKGLEEEKV